MPPLLQVADSGLKLPPSLEVLPAICLHELLHWLPIIFFDIVLMEVELIAEVRIKIVINLPPGGYQFSATSPQSHQCACPPPMSAPINALNAASLLSALLRQRRTEFVVPLLHAPGEYS